MTEGAGRQRAGAQLSCECSLTGDEGTAGHQSAQDGVPDRDSASRPRAPWPGRPAVSKRNNEAPAL